MSRRSTFTDRRRDQLARHLNALESLENRAMITDSLGIMMSGIGMAAAVTAFHSKEEARRGRVWQPACAAICHGLDRRNDDVVCARDRGRRGWRTASPPTTAVRSAAPAAQDDWLTLFRGPHKRSSQDAHPRVAQTEPSGGGGGGGGSQGGPERPRQSGHRWRWRWVGEASSSGAQGGSGPDASGAITPLRLPAPPGNTGTSAMVAAAGGTPPMAASSQGAVLWAPGRSPPRSWAPAAAPPSTHRSTRPRSTARPPLRASPALPAVLLGFQQWCDFVPRRHPARYSRGQGRPSGPGPRHVRLVLQLEHEPACSTATASPERTRTGSSSLGTQATTRMRPATTP